MKRPWRKILSSLAVAAGFTLSLQASSPAAEAGADQVAIVSARQICFPKCFNLFGNSDSGAPTISADGSYVAFHSWATNLVSNDKNGNLDVIRKEVNTGKMTLVSRSVAGSPGNGWSGHASMSADGRYVAFASGASNLVSDDLNGFDDVFLKDMETGKVTLVSQSSSGSKGNGDSSFPSISANGKWVAFHSEASNLVPGDVNAKHDVFLKEMSTGKVIPVSQTAGNLQGNGPSGGPSVSADGKRVAFLSDATNLSPGDSNKKRDVFLKDLETGSLTLVSRTAAGTQGDDVSSLPSVSADGRWVAFSSWASNLIANDQNGTVDVLLKNMDTAKITLVSQSAAGVQGNGASSEPSISADGKWIAFQSDASNLSPLDLNNKRDAFVKSVKTGGVTIPSHTSIGLAANGWSWEPVISAGGDSVAFTSFGDDLVSGDQNGAADIYRSSTSP